MPGFGRPVLLRWGKMQPARGMAAHVRDGYGAFRQPKFECGKSCNTRLPRQDHQMLRMCRDCGHVQRLDIPLKIALARQKDDSTARQMTTIAAL